jgi:hypothetical protein
LNASYPAARHKLPDMIKLLYIRSQGFTALLRLPQIDVYFGCNFITSHSSVVPDILMNMILHFNSCYSQQLPSKHTTKTLRVVSFESFPPSENFNVNHAQRPTELNWTELNCHSVWPEESGLLYLLFFSMRLVLSRSPPHTTQGLLSLDSKSARVMLKTSSSCWTPTVRSSRSCWNSKAKRRWKKLRHLRLSQCRRS